MNVAKTIDLYKWLLTDDGTALLQEVEKLPDDRLLRITRLRKKHVPELAEIAVEVLSLRKRAVSKFQNPDRLLLTSEGLEQSSSSVVANYRASKMPSARTLDACSGIGGDAIALAAKREVIAVDNNPVHAICTHVNTLQSPCRVRTICADVTHLDFEKLHRNGVEAAFFDPSRRRSKYGSRIRIKDSESYFPPLSWAKELIKHFSFAGVKVSPAIDDEALQSMPNKTEFISYQGQCKEAVLWLGTAGEHLISAVSSHEDYHATVLSEGGKAHTLSPFDCEYPPISDPREWIFEPDPAVIRAHLIPQVTTQIDGAQIDPHVAYLTGRSSIESPFTTCYRLLDWMPYHPKQLQQRIKTMGKRVVAIKLRGVSLKPEELIKSIKGTGVPSDPGVVVFIMRRGEKLLSMICEQPNSTSP